MRLEPFEKRRHEQPLQKERLCRRAVEQIFRDFHLDANGNPVSFILGPGTTSALFYECFEARDRQGRELTVVSANLDLISAFQKSRAVGRFLDLRLIGERVDFINKSLIPADGHLLQPVVERAHASFAAISCAGIWRAEPVFGVSAFTQGHAQLLKQTVSIGGGRKLYLMADDSKRELELQTPLSPESLERDVTNLFAQLPRDAGDMTLIVEDGVDPGSYTTRTGLLEALDRWWNKPRLRCFVSYSSAYEALAEKFYRDLEAEGVDCFKWNVNAKGSLWRDILSAIPQRPLVLLCGEHSLKSGPVKAELEHALLSTSDAGRPRIITLILDDYLFDGWEPEGAERELRKELLGSRGIDLRRYNGADESDRDELYENALREIDRFLREAYLH